MRKTFDGMYYKHQGKNRIISFIAGILMGDHAFVQVITNKDSYYFSYPMSAYQHGEIVSDLSIFNRNKKQEKDIVRFLGCGFPHFRIGDNTFSKDGIKICIEEKGVSIHGEIKYTKLTPLRYDIMGPFKYLPMQCKHKISSLYHELDGSLNVGKETIDFKGGTGYIEGDFGTSFPGNYLWIQCNDFPEKACIVASVADIPFIRLHFRGCICIVYIHGTEYRLATYLGVKILLYNENHIVLKQGNLRLEIEIDIGTGHKLIAPERGRMVREIRERVMCGARFKFMKDGKVLFEQRSEKASFEYVTG